jgi:peptidyl-prolyl cis-trans isomerase SDCCAG10
VVQGGDREHGDGSGGTSIFAERSAFPTEASARLRFGARGLVATAPGPRGNSSQFFVTLGGGSELERARHSIFGRVAGPSLFNLLRANECVVDADERPLFPPVITRAEVLENPFPDLGPRPGVRWQQEEEKQQEKQKKPQKQRRKNTSTLSFGEAGEEELLGAEEGGLLLGMSSALPNTQTAAAVAAPAAPAAPAPAAPAQVTAEDRKRVRLEENDEDAAMIVDLPEEKKPKKEEKDKKDKKKKEKKKKEKKKEKKEPKDTSVKKLTLKKVAPPPEEGGPDRSKEIAKFNEKKLLLLSKATTKQKQEETAEKFKKFRATLK